MGRIDRVYSNQIFIRVNGINNTDIRDKNLIEFGSSSTATKYMKKEFQRALKNCEEIDEQVLQEYSDTRAKAYRLRKDVDSNGFDIAHLADFWVLSNTCSKSEVTLYGTNNQMVLTTIGGEISRSYDSIDKMADEFVSLDEVLDNGQFLGREMLYPLGGVYLLYTYGNLGLLYFKDSDGKSTIFPKLFSDGVILQGDVNESMKNPSKIKTKVYKMQKELRGQID